MMIVIDYSIVRLACMLTIPGNGLTRLWLDQGTIAHVKTRGDLTEETVNASAALLADTFEHPDSVRPLALIHDFSATSANLNPVVVQHALDVLSSTFGEQPLCTAVVVPESFMLRLLVFTRNSILRQGGEQVRLFDDLDEALAWVRAEITTQAPPSTTDTDLSV